MKKAKVSKYGQWKYPGQDTIIPNANGSITMKGVPYPVLGIDDLGNQQIMMPGGEYQFPGNSVYEIPMARKGGAKKIKIKSLPKAQTEGPIQQSNLFTDFTPQQRKVYDERYIYNREYGFDPNESNRSALQDAKYSNTGPIYNFQPFLPDPDSGVRVPSGKRYPLEHMDWSTYDPWGDMMRDPEYVKRYNDPRNADIQDRMKSFFDNMNAETYYKNLDNVKAWERNWYSKRAQLPQFTDIANKRLNLINSVNMQPFADEGEFSELAPDAAAAFFHDGNYVGIPGTGFSQPSNYVHERSHWFDYNAPQNDDMYNGSYFKSYLKPGSIPEPVYNEEDPILNNIIPGEYKMPYGTAEPLRLGENDTKTYSSESEKIIANMPKADDSTGSSSVRIPFKGAEKVNNGSNIDYYYKPTEVRARLNEWRFEHNIDPTKNYTNEELQDIINSDIKSGKENNFDLYKIIRGRGDLLKQINDAYVSTGSKENPDEMPKAKRGLRKAQAIGIKKPNFNQTLNIPLQFQQAPNLMDVHVAMPQNSGIGDFTTHRVPSIYDAVRSGNPSSMEEAVDKYLGYPMDKAYAAADRLAPEGEDPIDSFRHPAAGMYTQQAIKDKVNIPIIGDIAGVIGSNLAGIGHELSTILKDERPPLVKGQEAFEDLGNNFAGSIIGLLPGTQDQKANLIYDMSLSNWLPDGVVSKDPNKNMYFKDEQGNVRRSTPMEMYNKMFQKKQGGVIDPPNPVDPNKPVYVAKPTNPYEIVDGQYVFTLPDGTTWSTNDRHRADQLNKYFQKGWGFTGERLPKGEPAWALIPKTPPQPVSAPVQNVVQPPAQTQPAIVSNDNYTLHYSGNPGVAYLHSKIDNGDGTFTQKNLGATEVSKWLDNEQQKKFHSPGGGTASVTYNPDIKIYTDVKEAVDEVEKFRKQQKQFKTGGNKKDVDFLTSRNNDIVNSLTKDMRQVKIKSLPKAQSLSSIANMMQQVGYKPINNPPLEYQMESVGYKNPSLIPSVPLQMQSVGYKSVPDLDVFQELEKAGFKEKGVHLDSKNEYTKNVLMNLRQRGGLPKAQFGIDWEGLSNPELARRAKTAGWDNVEQYRKSGWGYNTVKQKQQELINNPQVQQMAKTAAELNPELANVQARQDELYSKKTSPAQQDLNQIYYALSNPLEAAGHALKYGYVPQGNVGNYGIRHDGDAFSDVTQIANPFAWGNAAYRLSHDLTNKDSWTTGGGALNMGMDFLESIPLLGEITAGSKPALQAIARSPLVSGLHDLAASPRSYGPSYLQTLKDTGKNIVTRTGEAKNIMIPPKASMNDASLYDAAKSEQILKYIYDENFLKNSDAWDIKYWNRMHANDPAVMPRSELIQRIANKIDYPVNLSNLGEMHGGFGTVVPTTHDPSKLVKFGVLGDWEAKYPGIFGKLDEMGNATTDPYIGLPYKSHVFPDLQLPIAHNPGPGSLVQVLKKVPGSPLFKYTQDADNLNFLKANITEESIQNTVNRLKYLQENNLGIDWQNPDNFLFDPATGEVGIVDIAAMPKSVLRPTIEGAGIRWFNSLGVDYGDVYEKAMGAVIGDASRAGMPIRPFKPQVDAVRTAMGPNYRYIDERSMYPDVWFKNPHTQQIWESALGPQKPQVKRGLMTELMYQLNKGMKKDGGTALPKGKKKQPGFQVLTDANGKYVFVKT